MVEVVTRSGLVRRFGSSIHARGICAGVGRAGMVLRCTREDDPFAFQTPQCGHDDVYTAPAVSEWKQTGLNDLQLPRGGTGQDR